MRHRKAGRKFGRRTNARKNLFRNLAVSLILHERMTTTLAKAKAVQPIVEKLVTLAREDTDYHRRLARARLGDDDARPVRAPVGCLVVGRREEVRTHVTHI